MEEWREEDDCEPPRPDPKHYREEWTEEPTHYQIYENVSEGTPTSPVFETQKQMVEWLIGQGHSTKAANKFAELGHAFSMTMYTGTDGVRRLAQGIDTLDLY